MEYKTSQHLNSIPSSQFITIKDNSFYKDVFEIKSEEFINSDEKILIMVWDVTPCSLPIPLKYTVAHC
jgi:hypothetical protein